MIRSNVFDLLDQWCALGDVDRKAVLGRMQAATLDRWNAQRAPERAKLIGAQDAIGNARNVIEGIRMAIADIDDPDQQAALYAMATAADGALAEARDRIRSFQDAPSPHVLPSELAT